MKKDDKGNGNKMKILGAHKDLTDKSKRAGNVLEKLHETSAKEEIGKKVVRKPTSISLDPEIKTSFEISLAKLKAEGRKFGIKGINQSSVVEKLMIMLSKELDEKGSGSGSAIVKKILKM